MPPELTLFVFNEKSMDERVRSYAFGIIQNPYLIRSDYMFVNNDDSVEIYDGPDKHTDRRLKP